MTSQYVWDRLAGRDPALRAADADRERTADRLRTGHAEGRLDLTEFQERLERCYESKTVGELGELVSDLPQDEHAQLAPRRLRPRHRRLGPLAPILIALLVVSAAAGHPVFWLLIPLMFLVWTWWHAPFMGSSRSRAGSG